MGEELLTSSGRGDSAPAEIPIVEPTCPACAYDLRGLRTGLGSSVTCPECGRSFLREELEKPRVPLLRREVDPRWTVVAFPIVAVMVVASAPGLIPGAGTLVLWGVAWAWLAVERGEGHQSLARSLGVAACLCALSVHTYGYSYNGLTDLPVRGVLGVNLVGAGGLAAGWLFAPRRGVVVALLLLAVAPAITGGAMLLSVLEAYVKGNFWTYWENPWPHGAHICPMLRWEAAALGAKMLAGGLSVAGAAGAARMYGRRSTQHR